MNLDEKTVRFWPHDFQGCPARCDYCDMPLLSETENDSCELRTIALLTKENERYRKTLETIRDRWDEKDYYCAIDRLKTLWDEQGMLAQLILDDKAECE